MTILCGVFAVAESCYGIYVASHAIDILKPNEQDLNRVNEFLDARYRQIIQATLLILAQASIIFLVRKAKKQGRGANASI